MLSRLIPMKSSMRAPVVHAARRGMARILATDEIDSSCVAIFQSRGHEVDVAPTRPEEELVKVIGDYDALIVRSATKVTPAVFQAGTKLRVVGRAGVGVDNINIPEATKAGVMVMNTPDGNTVSTAQLAMSLLCSAARRIPAADMSIKAGKWSKKEFMGRELQGKTIGIIGCGRIGQLVAQCAKGIGMTVIGYDEMAAAAAASGDSPLPPSPIEYQSSLDDIYAKSDFISVHTPLTPQTKSLLNDETIAKCKKGVHLINCARGGIIDEAALLRALESGHVGGAALDVYTTEPPHKLQGAEGEAMQALLAHPRVVCTPHLGASTEEAQVKVAKDIAIQMCDLFDQKGYVGIINVPFMSLSTVTNMKPFMTLAESIGAVLSQMVTATGELSRISKIEVKTNGGRDVNITSLPARQLLEAMVLKGVIKHAGLNLQPDMISAPALAKQIGIESTTPSDPAVGVTGAPGSRYWNLLSVSAVREDGSTATVSGAVLGSTPHLVQVNNFKDSFSIKPESNHYLSFRNEDKPGAVLEVLKVLHAANVNVANITVSRKSTGGAEDRNAFVFMAIDEDVPTNVMNLIKALPRIHQVSKIQLK